MDKLARSNWKPPAVPIGLDSYRQWDRWAYQRLGVRAYMRSTYDRSGGNEGADASHFLYQLSEQENVSLDVTGPGVLYFTRFNHWHGSPWRFAVDGEEHIVSETSSGDPLHPVKGSVFRPERLFPNPLTWTWSDTKGADLSWAPIPFETSLRLAYSRTHYGTGYYIYHQIMPGARLSHPLTSWNRLPPPSEDVLNLIRRSGTDLTQTATAPEQMREARGTVSVPADGTAPVATVDGGPHTLRMISFRIPVAAAAAMERVRLQITWDHRSSPSVDAPVALFYGSGTLYNRDSREYLVKAFPSYIRFHGGEIELAYFFPMPFFESASISLAGGGSAVPGVQWTIRYEPLHAGRSDVAYFHATYRDHPDPMPGHDLTLLDTREQEGGGDWSGHFVGTSFIFSHRANLGTLEGDPRFYFDDSQTPQAYGTGTEEWAGGGDYWGGQNMTLPFAGHPTGARSLAEVRAPEDAIESAYRFLLADLMPFGRNARITLEHGGVDESTEHYETVTYWYGAPAAALVRTDTLNVGSAASERAHGYVSPQASEPYTISSRYEWGVDHLKGVEIFPAHNEVGRVTRGSSEFSLKLRPDNYGVLLRRTLDYSFPNQKASVFVADPVTNRGQKLRSWRNAGTWYLAGSNTCVYSNPPGELDPARHDVQTSNRRFRDDEFMIPVALTRGRSSIRIRIRFEPVAIPLYPGYPLPPLGWSEIKYTSYCYVKPMWK